MRYINALRHTGARMLRRVKPVRVLRDKFFPGSRIRFSSSEQYWKERYERGGNSGEGSYGPLAEYKARFINEFFSKNGVRSAIELGCGDGNQASKLRIDRYVGIDISEKCVAWARRNFRRTGWEFLTLEEFHRANRWLDCEAGLSLDVIYHLIEDEVYRRYLDDLFESATRHVLIYSSNLDYFDPQFPHVRHRPVLADVAKLHPQWKFRRTEPNPYYRSPTERTYGSFAEFHVFEKLP